MHNGPNKWPGQELNPRAGAEFAIECGICGHQFLAICPNSNIEISEKTFRYSRTIQHESFFRKATSVPIIDVFDEYKSKCCNCGHTFILGYKYIKTFTGNTYRHPQIW